MKVQYPKCAYGSYPIKKGVYILVEVFFYIWVHARVLIIVTVSVWNLTIFFTVFLKLIVEREISNYDFKFARTCSQWENLLICRSVIF